MPSVRASGLTAVFPSIHSVAYVFFIAAKIAIIAPRAPANYAIIFEIVVTSTTRSIDFANSTMFVKVFSFVAVAVSISSWITPGNLFVFGDFGSLNNLVRLLLLDDNLSRRRLSNDNWLRRRCSL
jgi:hypothetical protein